MALKKTIINPETQLPMGEYINFKTGKEERCIIPEFERQNQEVVNPETCETEIVPTSVQIGEHEVFHYWINLKVYVNQASYLDGALHTMVKTVQIDLPYRPEGYSISEKYIAIKAQIEEFADAENC